MPTASIIRAIIALIMKTVGTSETSVNFHQTTRRNILEDSHLQVFLSSLSDILILGPI
jgi:hypothetical protein